MPNNLFPEFDGFMSRLSAKAEQVASTTVEKQAEQDPVAFANDYSTLDDAGFAAKYGPRAMLQRDQERFAAAKQERLAQAPRLIHETANDGPLTLARGAANLVGGTVALAEGASPVNILRGELNRHGIDALGTPTTLASDATSVVSDTLTEHTSEVSQLSAQDVALKAALSRADSRKQYDADVAEGKNGILATSKRVGRDILSGGKHLVENETAFNDMLLEQVPTLGIGMGAKAAVTAEQVAARASSLALRSEARQVLAQGGLREVAAEQLASRNVGLGTAAMEGGGVYQQTLEQINNTPIETLAQEYPEVAKALAAGEDPELIRGSLAQRVALTAAAVTAPLAGVTGKLTSKFELDPLTSGAGSAGRRALGNAQNLATETIEEGIQSGTGALATNLAEAQAGSNDLDLADGVGTQIGQGAVGGFGFAAAMQAPSVAANAAAVAGQGALAATKAVAPGLIDAAGKVGTAAVKAAEVVTRPLAERAKAVQAAAEAPAGGQQSIADMERQAEANLLAQQLANPDLAARTAAPAATDPSVTPEVAAKLTNNDPNMSRVEALSRALMLDASPDVSEDEKSQLAWFTLKNAMELRQDLANIEDPRLHEAAMKLLENDTVRKFEEQLATVPEDVVQGMFAQLGNAQLSDQLAMDPETEQALTRIKTLAYVAPDRMSTEQLEPVVRQSVNMDENDRRQLELAYDLAQLRETHAETLEDVAERTKLKAQNIVTDNVTETGFDLGNRQLKSVSQHIRAISSSMANGDIQAAIVQMQDFGKFAAGFNNKALAFDNAAKAHVDAGKDDQTWIPVEGTRRLASETRLGREQNEINVTNEKSRGLIEAVFADATVVAQSYNRLAKQFPELIEAAKNDKAPLTDKFETPTATWTKHIPTPKVSNEGTAAVSADAGSGATAASATTGAATESAESTAPRDAAPAEAAQKEEPAESDDADARALAEILASANAAVAENAEEEAAQPKVDNTGKTLEDALALSEDEYIAAINPKDKRTSDREAAGLVEELDNEENQEDLQDQASRGEVVAEVNGITYRRNDNFIYALDGETVVGQIASISTGTTSGVATKYQGRGIGTELGKQLIKAIPFAPAGSMSAAGEKARRAAFRALKAEQTAAAHNESVAGRFPGLVESHGESRNKFLASFSLAKKARSLFARFPDLAERLKNATTPEALKALYEEGQQYLALTGLQTRAMQSLLTIVPNAIAAQMNQSLVRVANGQKADGAAAFRNVKGQGSKSELAAGFLKTLLNQAAKPIWQYENRLSLHFARWGEGVANGIEFQPQVLQAVSLAATHWAVNMLKMPFRYDAEAVAQQYPNATEELRAAFQSMHFVAAPAQDLARQITDMLGVRGNANASTSYTDTLPKALALDAINAMELLEILTLHEVETGETNPETGKPMTATFIAFNEDAQTSLIAQAATELERPTVLTRLLFPQAKTMPLINEAPTQVNTRMDGTNQKLSDDQRKALENQGKNKSVINVALVRSLQALGKDNFLFLRGYDVRAEGESRLNVMHLRSVAGKNRGLVAGFDHMSDLVATVEQYAAANGMKTEEVGVYFPARMIGNTRALQNATASQQSNKTIRATVSATTTTLDLANPVHELEYHLAIAQALGEKVAKARNQTVTDAIRSRLASEESGFPAIFALIDQLHASEEQSSEREDIANQLTKALRTTLAKDGEPITDLALAAVFDYARFLKSSSFEFQTHLTFEHDGVTDGPINALVHLGLTHMDAKRLQQLRQGGLLLNTKENSVNEMTDLGDLYGNTGVTMGNKMRDRLADPRLSTSERQQAVAAINLLQRAKHVSIKEGDGIESLVVTRAPGKASLMPSVYGSSNIAVVRTLANAIIDDLYIELSRSIEDGVAISQALEDDLQALMGRYRKDGEWTNAARLDLSDLSKYKDFRFHKTHLQALVDNLMQSAGKDLGEAVEEELGPVLKTFKLLYAASAFQITHYRREFNRLRDARRAELVASGELGEMDALSRTDEEKIANDLLEIQPIYQLLHSAGEGRDHGINIGAREVGSHSVNGKLQQVRSIFGKALHLNVNATQIADAGVRIAAILVQGLGDATMMAEYTKTHTENFLQVFDGLETPPGQLKQAAREINAATVKGWQYNGLQAVVDSFATMTLTAADLSAEEQTELVKALHLSEEETEQDANAAATIDRVLTNTRLGLELTADTVAAYKQVIFGGKIRLVADHMAGAEGAHIIEADLMSDAEAIELINSEAQAIAATKAEERAKAEADAAPKVEPVAAPAPAKPSKTTPKPTLFATLFPAIQTLGMATLTKAQLLERLSSAANFEKPLHFAVFNMIKASLPDNLVIHAGNPSKIREHQLSLDPGANWGDAKTNGTFYSENGLNVIHVKNGSEETLLHELVHSVTTNLLRAFYTGAKNKLTSAQRDAATQLEKLTREFVKLDFDAGLTTANGAQKLVREFLAEGNLAAAVDEFIAYTMTNRPLANALSKIPGLSTLKAMAQRTVNAVRKLLNLPQNVSMDTFMEQAFRQTQRLVRTSPNNLTLAGGAVRLEQLEGSHNLPHERHLEEVHQLILRLQAAIPRHAVTPENIVALGKAYRNAVQIREAFLDAGFPLTDREQHVFAQIQAGLATGIQLDARTMAQFQTLHTAALKELTFRDFMENPASTDQYDIRDGERRYSAFLGSGTQRTDHLGRSNLLANFIALALVYQPLRTRLTRMTMPKAAKAEKTLDAQIKSITARVMEFLARSQATVATASSQRDAIDLLTVHLVKIQEAAVRRLKAPPTAFDGAEDVVRNKLTQVGTSLHNRREAREAAGKNVTKADQIINGFLGLGAAAASEKHAKAHMESLISMTNTANIAKPLAKLIQEAIGVTDDTRPVAQLLNQAKHTVARLRQRLRDEAPKRVEGLFSKKLDKQTWKTLYQAVANTDMQSLTGKFNMGALANLLRNPDQLTTAIALVENQLTGPHKAAWLAGAQALANFKVKGSQPDTLLRRNALALSERIGEQGVTVTPAEATAAEPLLERLISLRALQALGAHEQAVVAQLLETEAAGMENLLQLLATLTAKEKAKQDYHAQRYNLWKGYAPQSLDPRSDLVLATPERGRELLKMGYRLVAPYQADTTDPSATGMAYYASSVKVFGRDVGIGGQATYNQGAMQTVEGSVGGVDRLSGRTLGPDVKTLISHPRTVAAITRAKGNRNGAGYHALLPIFNSDGGIVAYERVLDRSILQAHLRGDNDLSKSIGIWLGRQAEEEVARKFNEELVHVLAKLWDKGQLERKDGEFVDVSASTESSVKQAWAAIPRETQKQLKAIFPRGKVMVRKDMIDNALGYRSASVADVFTGETELSKEVREVLLRVAYGLPVVGKNAYAFLVTSERVWQDLIGTAKDWIVVRSGVVALANAVANQFQLMAMGIPPHKLLQLQAAKFQETYIYLNAERRLAELALEKAAATNRDDAQKLLREEQQLTDVVNRLSIRSLIHAGEFPSIAEGLSEQDEYGVLKDFTGWLEKQAAEKFPPGVMTAAKFAVIAKDTAIYQGLSRAVQFGDFVAKAVLFDHLIEQGKTEEQALRKINETFVNYNLLAGRTRDYAESVGLTWFLNYKIRIQKVVISTIRENPLRFLMAGVGADLLGSDSLASSSAIAMNWSYPFGPGQFFSAHDMLMWEQMVD